MAGWQNECNRIPQKERRAYLFTVEKNEAKKCIGNVCVAYVKLESGGEHVSVVVEAVEARCGGRYVSHTHRKFIERKYESA